MDLLKADLKKLYRNYLVPSLSAAIVTSVYSFVDMIAIGRGVGPNGAAALSIATPIFGVISFFGLLCGVGSSVYLGKARGEGRMEKSNAYFSASLLLTAIFTALVWGGFNLFSVQIYSIFGAKESLMPFVKTYTDLIVWTMPLFIFSSYFSCMVRSDGAPSRVMAAVIIGGVFNIFGDWFFVFPMDWGMAGAALATVCGTIVQFIILCSHFFSKNCLLKVVKPFRPARAFRNVLIAGFSAGVIDIAFIVLTVILNKQILRYGGEATLAVFGVVITCSSMFQHLFSGVGQAIQPIVSMNFGAGQIKRIQELDRLSAVNSIINGGCFLPRWTAVSVAAHNVFCGRYPGNFEHRAENHPYLFSIFSTHGDQHPSHLLFAGGHENILVQSSCPAARFGFQRNPGLFASASMGC